MLILNYVKGSSQLLEFRHIFSTLVTYIYLYCEF